VQFVPKLKRSKPASVWQVNRLGFALLVYVIHFGISEANIRVCFTTISSYGFFFE
jgi:hypothetical protein